MVVKVYKNLILNDYLLEPDKRLLTRDGQPIALANRPFQVLLYLIENCDRVVSRTELIERFWDGKEVYDVTLTQCVAAIRRALDERSDDPHFIQTRWAEGYRYIGPLAEQPVYDTASVVEIEKVRSVRVTVEEEFASAAPEDQVAIAGQAAAPLSIPVVTRRLSRSTKLILALAVIIIAATAWLLYRKLTVTATPPAPIRSIAVLPLKNLTGDAAQDYFSDGLTEGFIRELAKIKGLKVISRSSVFTFKGKEADPRDVGRKLDVAAVLEGSVSRSGDTVRVEVRLVSTNDGRVLWASDTYDRTLKDLFVIEDGIARSVVAELRLRVSDEAEPFKRYTNNVEAYQVYLKGRYFINNQYNELDTVGPEKNLQKAASYFEQAIQIDPNYAPAYAGLADAETGMIWFSPQDPQPLIEKAKAAGVKAVQLDDTLAEAHTALATVYVHEWDFEAARQSYERAIALNPDNAWARDGYVTYLMAEGQVDEMLAEIKRAEELDPLNISIINDRGALLYLARRYDESITEFRRAEEMGQMRGPNGNIGMCYLEKGMYEEAIKDLQGAREANTIKGRMPEKVAFLAVACGRAGKKEEARRLLDEVKKMAKQQYVPKTFFAYIYAALDDKERAFAMLESAYREHDSTLLGLKTQPWFDPLRADPRFTDLIRRLGLSS